MRKVLLNAVGVFRAGDVFDPEQGQQPLIDAAIALGGKVVDATELSLAASSLAVAAYARGDSGSTTGIMLAALSGSGGGAIAWSPSGNGNARTLADVAAMLEASPVATTITLVDRGGPDYVVDEVVDLKGSMFATGPDGTDSAVLRVVNGGQLRNGGFELFGAGMFNGGMSAKFSKTTGDPALAWDSAASGFAPFGFGGGAAIQNTGSVPAIYVPPPAPDSLLVFSANNTGAIEPGTAPIVLLDTGATCIFASFNNGIAAIDPSWIVGDASNLLGFITDGFDFTQVAAWAGVSACTQINNPATLDGGVGPSPLRPVGLLLPGGVARPSTRYFDMDLAPPRPIYFVGGDFYDALGVGPV